MHAYEGSEIATIQISAEFPVQSEEEGRQFLKYLFLSRALTKMFWGKHRYAGTPPPLCFLAGFGQEDRSQYLPKVPCAVTSSTHTMPENRDYILVDGQRVPTQSTLQLVLQPMYSRNQLIDFNPEQIINRTGSFI
jgi:hypothetical protein